MTNIPLLVLLLGALPACGDNNTAPVPSDLKLILSVATSELVPAQQSTIAVSATMDGKPTSSAGTTFTSSSPSVATVSPSGDITAVSLGSGVITARLRNASSTMSVRVVDGGILTPAGGTIRMSGGQAELIVPAGAVTLPTVVRLSQGQPPPVDATNVVGSTVSIGNNTLVFAQPVTLRLRYDAMRGPLGLPQSALGIRRVAGAGWVDIQPSVVDSVIAYASAPIMEGGTYGVGRLVPTVPCNGPKYRVFDFWLGDWNVTSGGQPNGQNLITAEPGGCAVLELYVTPTPISPGRSISFYEPTTDRWYQTYVDAGGNRLDISSVQFSASSLVTHSAASGNTFQRHSWFLQPDGSVRQLGEFTTNNGASFSQLHDLTYRKR